MTLIRFYGLNCKNIKFFLKTNIFWLCFVVFILFVFGGCANNTKISDDETLIFDSLIIGTKDFYNPSKLRILEVSDIYVIEKNEQFPNGSKYVYIIIQGDNKVGGTLQKQYTLYLQDVIFNSGSTDTILSYSKGHLQENKVDILSDKGHSKVINISGINNAISKHYKNLGIN